VTIELDEEEFAGGGAYLFSTVLERFLGASVSLNSFARLEARSSLRKDPLGQWPPRSGHQPLL
jgi:type VI secretion system protein ImpG